MTSARSLPDRTPPPLRQLRFACARHGAMATDLPSGRAIAQAPQRIAVQNGGVAAKFRALQSLGLTEASWWFQNGNAFSW